MATKFVASQVHMPQTPAALYVGCSWTNCSSQGNSILAAYAALALLSVSISLFKIL